MISVLFGKPFDVSTDFLSTVSVSLREHHQQRKVGACKRVGPNAGNWKIIPITRIGRLWRQTDTETGANYGLSTSSSTLNPIVTRCERWSLNFYHTQKEFMSQPLQYTQKMHEYWSTGTGVRWQEHAHLQPGCVTHLRFPRFADDRKHDRNLPWSGRDGWTTTYLVISRCSSTMA